jgi:hypothetical protein
MATFFQGKRVRIVVGSDPGGGYDAWSRLLARGFAKYLPGNPAVSVVNQPAGGDVGGTRYTLNQPPNGLWVNVTHPNLFMSEFAGIDIPQFDPQTIKIVGSPTGGLTSGAYCINPKEWPKTWPEIRDAANAKGKLLTTAQDDPGTASGSPLQIAQLSGEPIKVVMGYAGTGDILASFDRGETDLVSRCEPFSVEPLYPDWVEEGRVWPVFRTTGKVMDVQQEWWDRIGAGDVPLMEDVMNFNETQKTVYDVSRITLAFSRIFVLHPDTADNVHQAYIKAFKDSLADPEIKALAESIGRLGELSPGNAEDLAGAAKAMDQLGPEGLAMFKKVLVFES